jgi:cysteinyl-tRNA synthetase
MSKSLGNFFTIREVLEKYDAEVVRFFILRAHYRSPLNYSDAHLDDAKHALARLYTALKGINTEPVKIDWHAPHAATFKAAMDDDFNTPMAVAELQSLAREINTAKAAGDTAAASRAAVELRALGARLGLLGQDPEAFLRKVPLKQARSSAAEVGGAAASGCGTTRTRPGSSGSSAASARVAGS